MKYQNRVLLLIGIATILRLFLTTATELSADEAYYWTYALKLQWNYFDHPPMVALLIRLTTSNLLLHNEFFVRLGAVLCAAVCTWIIFKIGTVINNLQTGWFAALLYTSSIYCSIYAGANILPDSPQMVFWLAGVFVLLEIQRSESQKVNTDLLWCVFGLTSGLCIMSKIHGVFLWVAVVLYALLFDRSWLKSRGLYISAVITLIVICPIIIWNFQHDFITYKFHSSRISPAAGFNLVYFGKAIIQQVNINNPFNYFLIVTGLIMVFKRKALVEKNDLKLLLCCSLPLIAVVLVISLFKETFPHWSAPAYSLLLVPAAVNLSTIYQNKTPKFPKVIIWAMTYTIALSFLQALIIDGFPGPISLKKEGLKTGANDFTLQMYGWRLAGIKFDSLYKSDVSKKLMRADAPLVITNWDSGASTEFYITHKTKQEVFGIGNVADLHQYFWSNQDKRPLKYGDDAYYIVPSDIFYYRTSDLVFKSFESYEEPLIIPEYRSGLVCRYIYVYRMKGYLRKKSISQDNLSK